MQEASEKVRAAVATLLGQLMGQPLHGPRITLLLSRLLPPGLVAAIQVTLFDLSDHPAFSHNTCRFICNAQITLL